MSAITINKLTEHIGGEMGGVDADRLLDDDHLPARILEALAQYSVLVFPQLNLDPATQVKACERLGEVDLHGEREPGIMRVTLDRSKSSSAQYLRGTFNWHMDGCTLPEGQYPAAATVLSAVAVAEQGGETEFASTYHAYDSLTPEEQEQYGGLRVRHTVAATQRRVISNPTPEEKASWRTGAAREHPLVWRQRSGRRSLVIGATADEVVGMQPEASERLLDELLERSTAPEKVYRHNWSVGDMVIWDNRGVLHRVEPYDDQSPREMIRTTLVGDEPIE